ncbi:MAG: hypothetical protein KAK00_10170 [Nanoarchaeota archaeon]|nr:hypothetical protein [Nanoarchaeota archaeon]
MPKPAIRIAINYYIGNYCYRKCFRHDSILNDCFKKFEILAEKLKDTKITIKEFNQMMKQGDIKICKLPFEKRCKYVPWKKFEYYNWKNTDYWDIEDENTKLKR